MAENSQRIPNVLLQPASVDFIQRRLPAFHPAFQGFENLQYDHTSNHFMSHESKMPSTQKLKAQRAAGRNLVVPVRKLVPAISAMEFWNRILTKAMAKFKAENTNMPKNLVKKPDYAIRDLTSWIDIHKNFQRAKTVYDGNNSGVSRVTKRIYRYVADNSEVLKVVTNFVPDGTYVTPVKTAIEGIVDSGMFQTLNDMKILQTAAKVRELVRSSFEDDALEKSFAKVEIYLATFPKDENIEIASVALIACVLKAVELAIAFLLSSTGKRAAKSLLGGLLGDYMQELADSISEISLKTQDIIDTANDSNIVGTREAMDLSLEAIEELLLLEVETEERVKIIATKADLIIEQEGKVILALSSLTSELQNQFQQHATTLKQAMEEVAERNRLALANEFGEMLAALEKRRDAKDAREAEEAKKARDAQDAKDAQTLQLLSSLDQQMQDLKTSRPATPVPPQQHPPTWPSPSQPPALYPSQWLPVNSQALYQQWVMPISYNYSRLDPSGSPYPASQWTAPIPLAEQILGADDLLQVLNVSNMDREDLEEILGSSDSVDLKYRLRTRAIVRTDEFQCWLTTPESRELLIQGDRSQEPVQQRNAVSLVVASLIETLRSRDRYISLVFFCRRHTDIDDTCAYAGPAAMIRSFIAQLLMQSYQGYSFACSDLDLEGIHAGDVAALCALLEWLVKYLPEKEKRKMLVCVADGIDAYENGEEEDDLRKIIDSIVGLARSEDSDRAVKVLATSPFGTVSIDEAFEHAHSSFLSMNSLQIVSYAEDALEFEEVTDE